MSDDKRKLLQTIAKRTDAPARWLEETHDALDDIPLVWLQEGMRRFIEPPAPQVVEILQAVANAIRYQRDKALGIEATLAESVVEPGKVQNAIDYAIEHAPLGVGQLQAALTDQRRERRAQESPQPRALTPEEIESLREPEPESLPELKFEPIDGRDMTATALAQAIFAQGHHVPRSGKPNGAGMDATAMVGQHLGILLARVLRHENPITSEWSREAWERLNRHVEVFQQRVGDERVQWWLDRREEWFVAAVENDAKRPAMERAAARDGR